MPRTKQQIELRAPDLANLTPDQRDWVDKRVADALEYIFSFPLEEHLDENAEEVFRRSE